MEQNYPTTTKSSERLQFLLKKLNISANKLAGNIGLKSNAGVYHILSGRNEISESFAYKVSKIYHDININWLLTGEGNMYKDIISYENSNDDLLTVQEKLEKYHQDYTKNIDTLKEKVLFHETELFDLIKQITTTSTENDKYNFLIEMKKLKENQINFYKDLITKNTPVDSN